MLNGNLLVIMGVPEFGELTLESNMSVRGYPMQMMLDGEESSSLPQSPIGTSRPTTP
ncbi:MAG: hypothetical protein Ct9H300mP30_0920 [Methanobacteriota archaeon]|nr:MAG: hypothetical protein Ct9H300mP30_0920 [Euryarchaeota archaeon]